MKIVFSFLGALTIACKLQASPSVDWVSDSAGSLGVILTGNGPGWSGTVTSPSGLWQLTSANIVDYPTPNQSSPLVLIENSGVATFLGSLSPQFAMPDPSALAPFNSASLGTFGGYQDFFSPTAPIRDGTPLDDGYLAGLHWSGMSTLSVTSIPNVINTSCWAWTASYSACGESLEAPEPSTISIGTLAVIFGLASIFRKKLEARQPTSVSVKSRFWQNIPVVVRPSRLFRYNAKFSSIPLGQASQN
jgi:hypothetical protein